MIVSASRRTDIPGFYGDWFMNRIRAGFAYVRNPFAPSQIIRVPLSPDTVDCIVFWTKNPAPFFSRLDELDERGFAYYFRFTVTPYDALEPGIDKAAAVETFMRLSDRLGREKVVWAYDPILFTPELGFDFHAERFGSLCDALAPYTDTCVLSLYDDYRSAAAARAGIFRPSDTYARALCGEFTRAAAGRLRLQACCDRLPVERGGCIDFNRIERITGCRVLPGQGRGQRKGCLCAESVDIGAYDCCPHGCRYCYANHGDHSVKLRVKDHDPSGPLLLGQAGKDDEITELNVKPAPKQLSLFSL